MQPVLRADGVAREIEGSYAAQSLFRVDVDSQGPSGRMRLVLRDDPEHPEAGYHVSASDAFGRRLWSLAAVGGRLGWVDHRAEVFCETSGEAILPEAGLAGLPAGLLPRILRGRLPVDSPESEGAVDFHDPGGRRWTAELEAAEPTSWTLWEEGRPLLWWRRLPEGGILSHREGTQFRWRLSVSEPAAGEFFLAVPADYHRADCVDWNLSQLREDQPAPAGDRPPR